MDPAGGEVPLPDWSLFDEELGDLGDELRAAFRKRAIPSPVHVTRDPQRLSDERRYDLPTGHWPQFTRPAALGQAILTSLGPV